MHLLLFWRMHILNRPTAQSNARSSIEKALLEKPQLSSYGKPQRHCRHIGHTHEPFNPSVA